MARIVDAARLTLSELIELAHAAAESTEYVVLTGCTLASAFEIRAITTMGRGYVSFRFESAGDED